MNGTRKTKIQDELVALAQESSHIPTSHYGRYNVKRGLRNANGTGVLVGLTEVGNVVGYDMVQGEKHPCHGRLYYRGYGLDDLCRGFLQEGRFGFEETIYLLLFGGLPTTSQLRDFQEVLASCRSLPEGFTENMILKIPSKDIMNKIQRSVLVLYSHDDEPDRTDIANVVRQSIELIARFPTIISYGYQAKAHYFDDQSLFIHKPQSHLSTAENILHMIRPDNAYSPVEAEVLDLCLVIHAEHGGGNNSTFATHVVSSSGTDTYSAISAAVGSLKGHKHGGANNRVRDMIDNIRLHVPNWQDPTALKAYLAKILDKEAYNGEGLVYGMGHAVYTLSDPRAELLKQKAWELAVEKDALDVFALYANIEGLTKALIQERKGDHVHIAANVDLYSGFVYEMLGIPPELYTPLFATARIAGWCAHRMEQIASDQKIIRPAYKTVGAPRSYTSMGDRTPPTVFGEEGSQAGSQPLSYGELTG